MLLEQILFFVAAAGAIGGAMGVVLLPLATLNVVVTAVLVTVT